MPVELSGTACACSLQRNPTCVVASTCMSSVAQAHSMRNEQSLDWSSVSRDPALTHEQDCLHSHVQALSGPKDTAGNTAHSTIGVSG